MPAIVRRSDKGDWSDGDTARSCATPAPDPALAAANAISHSLGRSKTTSPYRRSAAEPSPTTAKADQ